MGRSAASASRGGHADLGAVVRSPNSAIDRGSARGGVMSDFVLALDQGTTSSRAILFDRDGTVRSVRQREFSQHFPRPGWVEHDAEEIWRTQLEVALGAIDGAGLDARQIAAFGITNQRETTVVWERATARPIGPAIVWQDRRTSEECEQLRREGLGDDIRRRTGLVIDAYFSATKLRWILDHVDGARARAERGELAFGTIDSWLLYRLTGGRVHATDPSNASRTMLYNIHEGRWDEEVLRLFGIPPAVLPEVRSSSEVYGETDPSIFEHAVPVAGIAGDQQAALFGQMGVEPGVLKNTYGTGCFMVLNTGGEPVESRNNLLTTVAWRLGERATYALEGSVFIAGAVVQWLRDGLGLIESSADVESLAGSVDDNGGVYLVPAFSGLGAPHWDPFARGTIVGITRGTSAGHIARAALESIAFQSRDVLKAMEADSGIAVDELRVDGGAAANDTLMQFQSDILEVPLLRPRILETTALGVAYLAGLAVGVWRDIDEIRSQWKLEREFEPAMPPERIAALVGGWQRALERAGGWLQDAERGA
jgi:glycerol kinase